jgi:hypothetical protein
MFSTSPLLRSRRVPLLAAIVAIALLLAFAISFAATSRVSAQDASASPEASPVAAEGTEETGPPELKQVTVGFYLTSIYDLDQQTSTYYADFYMWMRWQGDYDPTFTVEILNNIERWGLTMTPIFEEPKELPTGELLQQFHVQGQFFQPLSLSD